MGENSLGEFIKSARAETGMTLRDLEAASGISFSQLSKYERGQSTPTKANLEKLANALNADKETLSIIAGFVDDEVQERVYKTVVDTASGSGGFLGATIGLVAGGIIGAAIGGALGAVISSKQSVSKTQTVITTNYDRLLENLPKWREVIFEDDSLTDDEKERLLGDILSYYYARKQAIIDQRDENKTSS